MDRFPFAAALARFRLRGCASVGARPRVVGAPHVVAGGRIVIGDDVELRSIPVQSHLVVGQGAVLSIGNGVCIESGGAIACQGRITIGDGVHLGAFCMLMDSDFHVAGNSDVAPEPKPIAIEAGARIGHRVVVLPGSRIGKGAVVLAGAVVSGEVQAHTIVSGNPARPGHGSATSGDDRPEESVPLLVQSVLGLPVPPEPDHGPDQISAWDSLGALRLVLALEEQFAITLTEDEIRTARSVRDIADRVKAAQKRRAAAHA